jgi:uncharacterized membrane protein
MLQIPPIPPWEAAHPLFVHFPIALLFLSPLFILISAIMAPPKGRPYMISALIILFLGTAGLFLAAAAGEAAATQVSPTSAAAAVLETHEEFAERSEIVFSGLSVILLGIVVIPRIMRHQDVRLTTTFMPLSFLILYAVGILYLVNTAHAGGRLVHEFGVHAAAPAGNTQMGVSLPTGRSASRVSAH